MNKRFFWGGSIAAHQCEGGFQEGRKGLAIMDKVTAGTYEKPRQIHEKCLEGYEYPSHTGIDFYHRYEEDIKLFSEMGFTALRISIDWSRIYPTGEEEYPNEEGLSFYRKVITTLRDHNIEPIVTLYHFELPEAIVRKYGSWNNRKTIELYLKYCRTVFEEYKDIVTWWATFNEMNHLETKVKREHDELMSYMVTGLACSELDPYEEDDVMARCTYNMTVASVMAIEEGHRINPDFKIGCVFGFEPFYAFSCHPEDSVKAFDCMEDEVVQIDAMCLGRFPERKLKEYETRGFRVEVFPEDAEFFRRNRLDFIGLNYYASATVGREPLEEETPDMYGGYHNPLLEKSSWGWTIDPVGLRYALRFFEQRYRKPVIITENGIGAYDELEDGTVQDDYRIEYLRSHFKEMKKAVEEDQVNCIGYLMWGPIDLISATTGEMKKRYGFIYVDKNDDGSGTLKRYPKKSFYWYRQVIESNGENLDF